MTGELTGPTSATPSDEAAKALLSCGNPATAIIAYRRVDDPWWPIKPVRVVQFVVPQRQPLVGPRDYETA